jgi:hypothetical protein
MSIDTKLHIMTVAALTVAALMLYDVVVSVLG